MFYQVLRELKTLDPRSAVCGIQLILSQTSYARSGLKRCKVEALIFYRSEYKEMGHSTIVTFNFFPKQ